MMKRFILTSLVVLAFAATARAQTGREIAQKVKTVPMAIPVNRSW